MEKDKSLLSLLAACAQKSTGQGVSRLPQFLAMKESIEEALRRGWSMKTIWEVLYEQKKFTGRYNCFAIYDRKYIKKNAEAEGLSSLLDSTSVVPVVPQDSLPQENISSKPGKASPTDNWKPETESSVFDYNPTMTDEKRKNMFGSKKDKKQEESHG